MRLLFYTVAALALACSVSALSEHSSLSERSLSERSLSERSLSERSLSKHSLSERSLSESTPPGELRGLSGLIEIPGCVSMHTDHIREYMCTIAGTQYTVKGLPDDYAYISCTNGDVDLQKIPLIPLSSNGTLNTLTLHDCALGGTLANVLARVGASGTRELALYNTKGVLTGEWVRGVTEIQRINIVNGENQFIPWDVLDALPALEDLRLRDCSLTLNQSEDPHLVVHPALESVELSLDKISSLPRGVFAPLGNIKKLYIWGNNIEEIRNDSFIGLNQLEVLDLSRNPLKELRPGALAALPTLKKLTVVATQLKIVHTDAFVGLRALEEVLFMLCRGGKVQFEPRALAALPALKALKIDRCNLEALPEDLMVGTRKLQNLTITACGLTELPTKLLSDQKQLMRLELQMNQLTAIPVTFLRSVTKLIRLNLDDNLIQKWPAGLLSGLNKLEEISCNRNNLSEISPRAFEGATELKELSLADNQLTFQPKNEGHDTYMVLPQPSPFYLMTKLLTLVLRNNSITTFPNDWYLLTQLKKLDFSYNKIEEIYQSDLQFTSMDAVIDLRHNLIQRVSLENTGDGIVGPNNGNTLLLEGNPFRCDCYLHTFMGRLEGTSHYYSSEPKFQPGDARCASPPPLAGRLLTNLRSDELFCDLPPSKGCPPGCQCLIHEASSALRLDCTKEPAEYPNPQDYHLTKTDLHLRGVPQKIPAHVAALNLSGTALETPPSLELLKTIKTLDLSGNNLTSAPFELLTSNMTMYLSGNPFQCDCSHWKSVDLLQKMISQILDGDDLRCSGGEPLRNVDVARLCDVRRAALLGGSLALIGLLAVVAAVLAYRYTLEIKLFLFSRGWFFQEEDIDKTAKYDAFISFSQEDARWVAEKLVPVLEDQYEFNLCVHYRDWIIGDMIPAQIARSVEESRRTIVVLSKSFVKSTWAMLEFRAANQRAQRERRARVLVLVLDEISELEELDPELRAYLNTNTYLRWGDSWFWEKLKYAMPHKKAVKGPVYPDKLKRGALDVRITQDGKIVNGSSLPTVGKEEVNGRY